MSLPSAASSAFFSIPKFTRGDLEEVMGSLRPHEIGDLHGDLPLPFLRSHGENGVRSLSLRDLLDLP